MTRKKGKSKRGESPAQVDFVSHLTVEECLEHLRSGRSPVKEYSLRVVDDGSEKGGSHFRITAFTSQSAAYNFRSRGGPVNRQAFTLRSEQAAFEGDLEPVDAGTRVRGEVQPVGLPVRRFLEPVLIAFGVVFLLAFGGIVLSDPRLERIALWVLIALITLALTGVWGSPSVDYPNWLADYVRERLDVRRDHF